MANKILNLIFKADATQATREIDKLKGTLGAGETGAGGTGVLGVGSALQVSTETALALGATVKIFDDSIYKLINIQKRFNQRIFTSAYRGPD